MFSSTFVRRTHHLPSLPFVVVYLCALGCGSDLASSPADGGASSTGGRAWTAGQGGLNAGQGGSALSGGASGGAQTSGTSGASGESGANTTGGAGQAGATGGGSGATAIATPVGYTLVWHDEFETDGAPNPSNYNFERGFLRNEEAQFYQAGNATVKNGLLVIEAPPRNRRKPQLHRQRGLENVAQRSRLHLGPA